MPTPRGIRNCNPGNIRWGDAWQGLVTKADITDSSFCQFTDPVYGIRAMAKIFSKYANVYGLTTPSAIIARWAPPTENNTPAYVASVAAALGVGPDDRIDVHEPATMIALLKAVIYQENGVQPYDDATLTKGIALASA